MPAIPPPPFPTAPNSCLACLQRRKETVYTCQYNSQECDMCYSLTCHMHVFHQGHACFVLSTFLFEVLFGVYIRQLPTNRHNSDQHMLQCRLPTSNKITASIRKMSQQLCVNACFKYTVRLHEGITGTMGLPVTQAAGHSQQRRRAET